MHKERPARRGVDHGDVLHERLAAAAQEDHARRGRRVDAPVAQVVLRRRRRHEAASAAIDGAAPGQRHILAVLGQQQAACAAAREHRCVHARERDRRIVPTAGRGQQRRPGLDVQLHMAAQAQRAGEKHAVLQDHPPARARAGVDGALKGLRVHRAAVSGGTEVPRVNRHGCAPFRVKRSCQANPEHSMRHLSKSCWLAGDWGSATSAPPKGFPIALWKPSWFLPGMPELT